MKKTISCLILLSLSLALVAQKNVVFRDTLSYSNSLNDVWGYADSLGNEYALVGVNTGVSIVDVTDPDSIKELFFVPGASSTWRDLKTWNKHAYITNEQSGGLMIIDLSNLPDTVTTTSYTNKIFDSAHDIFIDENGFAYIFGANSSSTSIPSSERGALILDLNNDPYKNFLKIRAYDTWPGTFFFVDKNNKKIRIKIVDAEFKNGELLITSVIPEGKKEISYQDFLRN